MHIYSGVEVCRREGKVAFGFSNQQFFEQVDSLRRMDEDFDFIYASLTEESSGAQVSFRGVYTGCVEAVEGKHPEGERFRLETTRSDGNWHGFWEV